jgi:hypothetical protein
MPPHPPLPGAAQSPIAPDAVTQRSQRNGAADTGSRQFSTQAALVAGSIAHKQNATRHGNHTRTFWRDLFSELSAPRRTVWSTQHSGAPEMLLPLCCLLPAGAQRTDGALLHSQAALGRADRLIDASDDVPSSTGDLGARAPPVVQSTAGRTQQQVEQDAGAQLECGTRLGVAVTKCDGDELSLCTPTRSAACSLSLKILAAGAVSYCSSGVALG